MFAPLYNTGYNRDKSKKRRRAERLQRKLTRAEQDNTPADLRVVLAAVAAFTCALVLLTKLALGL